MKQNVFLFVCLFVCFFILVLNDLHTEPRSEKKIMLSSFQDAKECGFSLQMPK